jgi:TP901 family phage tail tape measure protein
MKTYTGANIKSELLVDISSATKSIDSFVSSANAKLQTLGNSLSKDLNLTGMKSLFGTTQLKDFNSQLKSTTTAMTNHNNSVNKVNNQYTQLKSSLKQTGQQMSTVTSETNKSASANNNLVGQLQQNVATYMQFYAVLQQVRNALSVHQEIDKSLTETRKVAGLTKEEMRAYQQETIGVANSLGVLQTDLIDATTEFVRLGHAFEDAKELGEIATIGARVGDISSTETVSDYLISTISGFEELEMTVEGATTVVDKFNNVANNTSINFQAIGEGVKRFASSMSTANNSLDESISLLVAGYDVTRDAPKVANALNTISMRLRGVTEDGEEVAELIPEIDDVLGKYGLTMEKVGEDGTKALKSTFEILGEISEIWDYLSDMDKSEIIEAVAGIRQSNVASAILSNWESVQKTMELVGNSAGSASNEYSMYMDSMEASTNQFKNAVNALYQHIASSDEMISLINTFTSFIECPFNCNDWSTFVIVSTMIDFKSLFRSS